MKFFRVIDTTITTAVNITVVVLFSAMLGIAVTQVFLRYFFSSGFIWGDVAARYMVIWVGFLGGVIATRENKNFHIDVLTRFLSPRYKTWFQGLANISAAVVCYYLGMAGLTFLEIESGNKTFLDLPIVIVEVIVPAGFFLMMIQFILRVFLGVKAESHTLLSEQIEEVKE